MDLPTRTKQQKAESASYAILLYKLRHVGIFRNLTENDYGIDFEIEYVAGDSVTGRFIKAQVKSAEDLFIRKSDSVPTVGGIKQSTLRYWCELSYHTHVVAYAVDLKSERVYISRPLFWQASRLIDGSQNSKTIEFIPAIKAKDGVDQDVIVGALTVVFAQSPQVPQILYALTTAFRYLKDFFELRVDAFHYDPGTELHRPEVFRALLEVCSILLFAEADTVPLPKEDRKHMFSVEHWARKWSGDSEITTSGAQAPLKALLPMLVAKLIDYRKIFVAGAYYWTFRNPELLALVNDTPLPTKTDDATLDDWGYRYEQVVPRLVEPASILMMQVHAKAAEARSKTKPSRKPTAKKSVKRKSGKKSS